MSDYYDDGYDLWMDEQDERRQALMDEWPDPDEGDIDDRPEDDDE